MGKSKTFLSADDADRNDETWSFWPVSGFIGVPFCTHVSKITLFDHKSTATLIGMTLACFLLYCHCLPGNIFWPLQASKKHHVFQSSCQTQARTQTKTLYMEQLACLTCWIKHQYLCCNTSSLRNVWMLQVCCKYFKWRWSCEIQQSMYGFGSCSTLWIIQLYFQSSKCVCGALSWHVYLFAQKWQCSISGQHKLLAGFFICEFSRMISCTGNNKSATIFAITQSLLF